MHFNWMECIQMLCITIIYTFIIYYTLKKNRCIKYPTELSPQFFLSNFN